MRNRSLLALILMVVAPSAAFGQDDADAMAVAKIALDKGSALFDGRDAAAMAATFVEKAEILLVKRASDTGNIEVENRIGRPAIQAAYAEIFKDRQPDHRSRNTVEAARYMGNDLMMIRGKFAFNVDQGDAIQFVQIRAREGDQWKVVTMQLFELAK